MPETPNYSIRDLARDNVALFLANYMKEKINYECYYYTGRFIIKSIRDFDDANLQTEEYPVLKVFKTDESINVAQKNMVATYNISVELILPQWEMIVGILDWISRIITKYLFINEFSNVITIDPRTSAEVSYNIKENQKLNKKAKYLNYSFPVIYNLQTIQKLTDNHASTTN